MMLTICYGILAFTVTGAEVGLVVLLEAVLGPLFVYLAYRDAPSQWTIIGGSLLLVVLAVHEAGPLYDKATDLRRSLSRRISTKMASSRVFEKETAANASIEQEEGNEKGDASVGSETNDEEATKPSTD